MTKLKMEHIDIDIKIDFALSPKLKILVDNKPIKDFTVTSNLINFSTFIDKRKWSLSICHYGKNYITHNEEYVEIKDIKLNSVSIGAMIWETIQYPYDISNKEKSKYQWKGNLYLGHNSTCTWNFTSPTEKMLRKFYKTDNSNTMNSQETTRETLEYMKKKFGITIQ